MSFTKRVTSRFSYLVLAETQCWILKLLDCLLIKVSILLPKLQQLRRWTENAAAADNKKNQCIVLIRIRTSKSLSERKPLLLHETSVHANPGYPLLLVFLDGQKAGAVDGNHNLLKSRQQILLLLPLARGRMTRHRHKNQA